MSKAVFFFDFYDDHEPESCCDFDKEPILSFGHVVPNREKSVEIFCHTCQQPPRNFEFVDVWPEIKINPFASNKGLAKIHMDG